MDAALVEGAEPVRPVDVLGRPLPTAALRLYGPEGAFLGVGRVDERGLFRPVKVLAVTDAE
jgi:hypothetical protein